jgi:hypothetical protein
MQKLIFFTAILLGPCYAILMGIIYGLRLALPDGHPLYEPVEEYLWALAGLIALGLAGLAAAIIG